MNNDSLGDRMKRYESVSKTFLTRRVPVIIRIDGKAFHTFTRGLKKPFDSILMSTMRSTMKQLCEKIQGCVFGYTQSDEITLVLTDYENIKTDAWFGYGIQKMCSIAASIATLEFNRIFIESVNEAIKDYAFDAETADVSVWDYLMKYQEKYFKASFDARCFSVPKDEVCNCLIWRQQDATRNSIEAMGQANFSHGQLQGKNCKEIQEMLWKERGINWNDLPTACKRGSACHKTTNVIQMPNPRNPDTVIEVKRRVWVIDDEIPIFSQDRSYIESLL